MTFGKALPIGIQTLKEFKEQGYIYVDKTPFVYQIIEERKKYYFLSRPRRFGKSLFLDTLKEVFSGNKELFKGLYIYDKYDFPSYPIIKINWGSGSFKDLAQISEDLEYMFKNNAQKLGLSYPEKGSFKIIFRELIKRAYEKYGQRVVVLIDEYDKPILDNLTELETAKKVRDYLKDIYSVLKDMEEYLRLAFLTGVSKFSKLNLFSGLNNIEDITLNPNYAEICGYTEKDLKVYFGEKLKDVNWETIRKWYNGYYYLGEKVYNPFDILLFISNNCQFGAYWWQTGNPSFLIELLKTGRYYIPEIEAEPLISEQWLNAFDVDNMPLMSLLWQTGYLTIKEKKVNPIIGNISYRLKVPNLEIQLSLNELFINYLTGLEYKAIEHKNRLFNFVCENKLEDFIQELKCVFSAIPYNNYVKNNLSNYEGYYASVVFTYLMALGYEIKAEDVTSKGRIDLTIDALDKIIILEFKVDDNAPAINQLKEKKYYEKYLDRNLPIYLIGINFDSKEKNIVNYQIEQVLKN